MSDLRRNALADKIKRYDETKKLIAQWNVLASPASNPPGKEILDKAYAFVREYVLILTRDGHVAPYLGMNFVEEILNLVLGKELRARLPDLNLNEVVKVVHEIPAGEGAK